MVSLMIFMILTSLPSFDEEIPVKDIRDIYSKEIGTLESISTIPLRVIFEDRVDRTGIPQAQAAMVKAKSLTKCEVYIKPGKIRNQSTEMIDNANEASRVTVLTTPENFMLYKDGKTGTYSVAKIGGDPKNFEALGKGYIVFLEAAHRLPIMDVKDVILGSEYEYTAKSDRPMTDPACRVTCKFRRKPVPEVAGARKKLLVTSGEFVLSPARHWAAESFDFTTNTTAHYVGTVEYQQVKGIDLDFVPKRVEFATSSTERTTRTKEEFVSTSIEPGEVSDQRFTLDDFGLGSLNKPASSGIPSAYLFAGLGALLLIAAIVLRIRGAKSKN